VTARGTTNRSPRLGFRVVTRRSRPGRGERCGSPRRSVPTLVTYELIPQRSRARADGRPALQGRAFTGKVLLAVDRQGTRARGPSIVETQPTSRPLNWPHSSPNCAACSWTSPSC
jgi:hypothetical protein